MHFDHVRMLILTQVPYGVAWDILAKLRAGNKRHFTRVQIASCVVQVVIFIGFAPPTCDQVPFLFFLCTTSSTHRLLLNCDIAGRAGYACGRKTQVLANKEKESHASGSCCSSFIRISNIRSRFYPIPPV